MSRLLYAEFSRLFHSFIFKLAMAFSVVFALFLVCGRWWDKRRFPALYEGMPADYGSADAMLFAGGAYMVLAIAVFLGIFVGTEYFDGTLRNKLIVGHTRRDVYLSKWVVSVAAGVMMHVVYIAAALAAGKPLLGLTMGAPEILLYTAAGAAAQMAVASLLLMIAMATQSKSATGVTLLIVVLVLIFATATVNNRLRAPEYYTTYEMADEETGEVLEQGREKNPYYLTGAKRKAYEMIEDISPEGQLMAIMWGEPVEGMWVVYDIIVILCTTAAGLVIFGRKNLN